MSKHWSTTVCSFIHDGLIIESSISTEHRTKVALMLFSVLFSLVNRAGLKKSLSPDRGALSPCRTQTPTFLKVAKRQKELKCPDTIN